MSRPEEHEELRPLLRDAAAGWEPDRTYMINRVAAGRSPGARHRSRTWLLRPAAAAASVVVVSVLSVVAVRAANTSAGTHEVPPAAQLPIAAATSPSAAGSRPSSTPATKPHSSPGSVPGSAGGSTPVSSAPGGTSADPPPAGPQTVTAKSAIGKDSVATWSECTVTVTTPKTVDALTVSIRVALSSQAADAGKYTTVTNSDVTMTVTRDAGALIYKWVLNKKARLTPGSYVFAAQFTHTDGRTWSEDGYQVQAGPTALAGGFD